MNEPLEQRLFTSKEDITTFLDPKETLVDIAGSVMISASTSITLLIFGTPFFDIATGAGCMGAAHRCINYYERKNGVELSELSETDRESKISFLRTISIASVGAFAKAYFFSNDMRDSFEQSIIAYLNGCTVIAVSYYLIWGWRRPRDSDRRDEYDSSDDDDNNNCPPGMKLDIPDYLPEDVGVEELVNSDK